VSGDERDQEMRRLAREVLSELVPGIVREVMPEPGRGTNGNGIAHGKDNGNGNGNGVAPGPVPQVPAPPLPAVLRPSTWNRPAAPGEIIGQSGPGGAASAPVWIPAPPAPTAPRARPASRPTSAPTPPPSTPPAGAEHPPAPAAASRNAIANPGSDARVETVTIDTDDDLMQFVRQLVSRIVNPRDRLAIHTGKLRFSLRSRPGSSAAEGGAAPAGPVTRIAKGVVTERVIREVADAGTRLVLAPGTVLTPLARERAQALGVEIEKERK
jgi:hypothetical protein